MMATAEQRQLTSASEASIAEQFASMVIEIEQLRLTSAKKTGELNARTFQVAQLATQLSNAKHAEELNVKALRDEYAVAHEHARQEKDALKTRHEADLATLRREHEDIQELSRMERGALEAKHESDLFALRDEYQNAQESSRREIDALEAKQAQLPELNEKHMADQDSLMGDLRGQLEDIIFHTKDYLHGIANLDRGIADLASDNHEARMWPVKHTSALEDELGAKDKITALETDLKAKDDKIAALKKTQHELQEILTETEEKSDKYRLEVSIRDEKILDLKKRLHKRKRTCKELWSTVSKMREDHKEQVAPIKKKRQENSFVQKEPLKQLCNLMRWHLGAPSNNALSIDGANPMNLLRQLIGFWTTKTQTLQGTLDAQNESLKQLCNEIREHLDAINDDALWLVGTDPIDVLVRLIEFWTEGTQSLEEENAALREGQERHEADLFDLNVEIRVRKIATRAAWNLIPELRKKNEFQHLYQHTRRRVHRAEVEEMMERASKEGRGSETWGRSWLTTAWKDELND